MAIKTTSQAAYDEAYRELQVRLRCYEKWVREGKISRTDASHRLDAQETIVSILEGLPDVDSMRPPFEQSSLQTRIEVVARNGDLTKQGVTSAMPAEVR